jgi:hypothetical protein
MPRAFVALLLAPLLVSLCFGGAAVLALPTMLGVSLLFALPMLLVLRRLGWLEWWQACLAGLLCGLLLPAIFHPRSFTSCISIQDPLVFGLVGAASGLTFWWVGVFRNPALHFVSHKVPYAMLVVIPIVLAVFWAFNRVCLLA